MGTDSRSAEPTTGTDAAPDVEPGSQRSDVLMVAQISPERTNASVVSIPRDAWVEIPGRGMNTINAAYALGGPSLLIRTVENLTDLRIDHFAVIDFAGFESMVDSVGGIDVRVAAATSNHGVDFHQSLNHLDGAQALAYVRQRYNLPRGDLDRAQRQQNALRALLSRAVSGGALSDPAGLYDLLDATSRTVGVDDTLSNGGLRSLAFELIDLRPSAVAFMSAPVRGLGREGVQSVVCLDDLRAAELWSALRNGTPADYAQRHPADSLGHPGVTNTGDSAFPIRRT
ncbi:LCP family protein [Pseudonocardia bannensis]|uniref:LCP family protein n=1 Tax=Pseudonocardia bannensis TaxID=630973 RepID=UPI0028A9F141|nr:LCP family protein [Pseudonocardia bannensis]